jgi:hypothetical protein
MDASNLPKNPTEMATADLRSAKRARTDERKLYPINILQFDYPTKRRVL